MLLVRRPTDIRCDGKNSALEMASGLLPPVSIYHNRTSPHAPVTFVFPPGHFISPSDCSTNQIVYSTYLSHRSSPFRPRAPSVWRTRCGVTSPRPPSPPEPESPHGEDSVSSSQGLVANFLRFQETVQIFFAVLFWMSLFFWSSVWDGRNKSDKGPRIRK